MRFLTIVSLALLSHAPISAQTVIGATGGSGQPFLLPSDAAVLESRELRKDLRCVVKPAASELGFDFTYHSGFLVQIPLRELAGGGALTSIFRVTPDDQSKEPVYFTQKWRVPSIDEDAKGGVELRGSLLLGEGSYHVSWLIRDRAERFCSARWQITVERRGKDRQVQLRLPPGSAMPEASDLFAPEAPVDRAGERPLRVLVFLHYAPHSPGAATVRPDETAALLAILRSVAREPRIGKYSLIVFNLAGSQTLFRQRRSSAIEFPAIGDAVEKLNVGTVTVERLAEGNTETNFLCGLVADEIADGAPDALIFIGPKMTTESIGLEHSLKALGDPGVPAFYLNYDVRPNDNPWRDLIAVAVRFWKGSEYTITRPRDLTAAWASVMSRLTDRKSHPGIRNQSTAGSSLFSKK
jgi:hypothetical protein